MALRQVIVIAVSIELCSCGTSQRMGMAESARTELVGMSAEQFLSCAGGPHRRAVVGSTEVLTYEVRLENPESGTHYCEVSVMLKDGRVDKVSYTGTTGIVTGHAHCARAIENCLSATGRR